MDKPQILIVEDDLDLAEMLNSYFQVQNYDVLTAAWGEEALQISREHDVSLIVLDIRLPDIDGYEVCRQLRTRRRTQEIPIIFLTERRDRVDRLEGLKLGVVDYITKPFDIQELRLRVRNAINRASQQKLINPVTDLPEGDMIETHVQALVGKETPWSLLNVRIKQLDKFREMYGFVAADDVLRALTLMIVNSVREYGSAEDVVGHLDQEDFVIFTQPDHVQRIQERIQSRVEQSREYFYPLEDRGKAHEVIEANQIQIESVILNQEDGPFATKEALSKAFETAKEA